MMQHQADMELENLKGQWQLKIEGMKKNMDYAEVVSRQRRRNSPASYRHMLKYRPRQNN
jgi:hypothetical protein